MSGLGGRIAAGLTAMLITAMLLGGCISDGASLDDVSLDEPGSNSSLQEDNNTSWSASGSTMISLSGNAVSVQGSGASVSGTTVTILSAGTYVVSGTLNNGQIIVNADKSAACRLILNGITMKCASSAPIYAKKAGKVIITLADGTTNNISDASNYVLTDNLTDEPDAALFVKNALTINGSGTLNVTGNYRNGITSKDKLVIAGGTISVRAAHDGIRGRDSVTVTGGCFDITAGGDGIKSNNNLDASLGRISLENGAFTIFSGNDCIQAETAADISGGTFSLKSGGGSTVSPATGLNPVSSDSYKGIKAGRSVTVNGGTFTMDCADDAVHSNGDVTVNNGSLTISTRDDGMHADNAMTVNGGAIKINKCSEGLEGMNVTVAGGDISIHADDDGINAGGGSDSGTGTFGGRFNDGASSSVFILISGGKLYVNAGGDGIDSNSALTITGGTVTVDGPTSNDNGALDSDGMITISGGMLFVAGSAGMAEAPAASSSQPSLQVYFTATQPAGTVIELKDAGGNTKLSHAPAKSFQNIVMSMSALKTGLSYTLYANGTELTTVTLSSAITKISESGQTVGGAKHPGTR